MCSCAIKNSSLTKKGTKGQLTLLRFLIQCDPLRLVNRYGRLDTGMVLLVYFAEAQETSSIERLLMYC